MILRKFNVEKCETDPVRIEALKAEGFVVIKNDMKEAPKAEEKQTVDYSSMLKRELVELALAAGIPGAKSLTKAELIDILEG